MSKRNRRIRIVQLTNQHFAEDDRLFYKMGISLAKNPDYEVFSIAPEEAPREVRGIQLVDTRDITRRPRLKGVKAVIERARSLQPDIIHFHDPDFFFAFSQLRSATPILIYDSHEYFRESLMLYNSFGRFTNKFTTGIIDYIEKRGARRCDAIVTVTETMSEMFAPYNSRTVELKNFAHKEMMEEAYRLKSPVPFRTGFLGSLDRTIDFLKPVSDHFAKHQPNAQVRLAGTVSPEIIARAFNYPSLPPGGILAPNTQYLGMLHYSESLKELATFSTGWVSLPDEWYYHNALPIKVFEIMGMGLPIVMSDLKLMADIVRKEECGIVVAPNDYEAHAEAHRTIWNNPELARRMSENARNAFLKTYNWESEEHKLFQLYEELIREKIRN